MNESKALTHDQQLIELSYKQPVLYEEVINGNICQIMIYQGEKTIRPLGDMIDTIYHDPNDKVIHDRYGLSGTQESVERRIPPVTPKPKNTINLTESASNDPVATLGIGIAIGLLCMIISFIAVKMGMHDPQPYKTVSCQPNYFLIFKTGETCSTEEGFR